MSLAVATWSRSASPKEGGCKNICMLAVRATSMNVQGYLQCSGLFAMFRATCNVQGYLQCSGLLAMFRATCNVLLLQALFLHIDMRLLWPKSILCPSPITFRSLSIATAYKSAASCVSKLA